jgi:molecular chaperone DnaK
VQGEIEQAHLCRLVGALEIAGTTIKATLPAGSPVEVTLELDRGGHLSARALVPALGQVFEEVAHLLVPDASPESLEAALASLRTRAVRIQSDASMIGNARLIGKITFVQAAMDGVSRDIAAARGGDADAAQKARRTLLDLDGIVEEAEAEKRWPEIESRAMNDMSWASEMVTSYGTPSEQKLLNDAMAQVEKARAARQVVELQRQLRVVRRLGGAAFNRHPKAATWIFEDCASMVDRATDVPKAQALVRDGRRAIERGDNIALRSVIDQLQPLMPVRVEEGKRLGHESGLR